MPENALKRLAAAVAAGSLLVAGCSSGGSGETPDGFARSDAEVLSVAHPEDWRRGPETGLPLSMQAPGRTAYLSVVKDLAAHGDPDMIEATIEAGPRMNAKAYRRAASEPIDVAGAQEALRIDYTFDDFGGTGAKGQGVDVGVIGGNGHLHTVRLTWQRGRLQDEVVDGIVDSVKVR